jgi:hypothetical protein
MVFMMYLSLFRVGSGSNWDESWEMFRLPSIVRKKVRMEVSQVTGTYGSGSWGNRRSSQERHFSGRSFKYGRHCTNGGYPASRTLPWADDWTGL